MPKSEEPARQIMDLDVREVSLVDRAGTEKPDTGYDLTGYSGS